MQKYLLTWNRALGMGTTWSKSGCTKIVFELVAADTDKYIIVLTLPGSSWPNLCIFTFNIEISGQVVSQSRGAAEVSANEVETSKQAIDSQGIGGDT
jgi:hypothetical protein